jgi:exopolysaccharide biosynthesis polyprenyl glycosylphosphotransferase
MFSRQHKRARVLFGLGDVVLTIIAFELAYRTRVGMPLEREFYLLPPVKALVLGFTILACLMIGLWRSVYDRIDPRDPRVVLRDVFVQASYAGVAVVLFEYLLRLDLSRMFLGLFGVYWFVSELLFRLIAARVQLTEPSHVVVVGCGDRARGLGAALERSARSGVRLEGFLADAGDCAEEIELQRSYPVFPLAALPQILRRHIVDEVFFAVGSDRLGELEDVFLACDEQGVRTRVAVDFLPHVNTEIYLERLGFIPLLTFSATPNDEIRLLAKRAIDLVIAAAGLLVLLPVMGAIAVLIKATSRGPVIFRQVRCGRGGRRFVFYKFRSMIENAEELKARIQHLNERSEVVFKIRHDPRVTGIGRWLRKFSIDEWPQLWNVLKGDMSLVGPRPAVPEEVEQYQSWQRRRLRMRPGLTCLWAIAGRDAVDFETWMKMDMQYIDNWSLALDWKIMLQTIPRVLSGKGAN